jgi:hypothetical protein
MKPADDRQRLAYRREGDIMKLMSRKDHYQSILPVREDRQTPPGYQPDSPPGVCPPGGVTPLDAACALVDAMLGGSRSANRQSLAYRRVLTKCDCCGQEYTAVPAAAKTTRSGDLTYHWFDCACGSGVVVTEHGGRLLTAAEVNFEFARHGVGT